MEGTLLHHSAPMQHVKFRVPTILTTPEIGGVPHHALERCIPLSDDSPSSFSSSSFSSQNKERIGVEEQCETK